MIFLRNPPPYGPWGEHRFPERILPSREAGDELKWALRVDEKQVGYIDRC